jgi:hypothetical protein
MALITNFLLGNIFYSYQRAAMNLAWYSQLKGKKEANVFLAPSLFFKISFSIILLPADKMRTPIFRI